MRGQNQLASMMSTMGDSGNMGDCETAGLSRAQLLPLTKKVPASEPKREKSRPVAAIHYLNHSSLSISWGRMGVVMASSRSKLRVAVRVLIKARERTRRRIRRRAQR